MFSLLCHTRKNTFTTILLQLFEPTTATTAEYEKYLSERWSKLHKSMLTFPLLILKGGKNRPSKSRTIQTPIACIFPYSLLKTTPTLSQNPTFQHSAHSWIYQSEKASNRRQTLFGSGASTRIKSPTKQFLLSNPLGPFKLQSYRKGEKWRWWCGSAYFLLNECAEREGEKAVILEWLFGRHN